MLLTSREFLVLALTSLASVLAVTVSGMDCNTEGSVYNAQKMACECMPGYEGTGDLCCIPKDSHDVCTLVADPVMTSVDKVTSPVTVPCSICMNVMEGKSAGGLTCVWEVLQSSVIENNGGMFSGMLTIGVSVNKQYPQFFTFDGTTIMHSKSNVPLVLGPNGEVAVDVEGASIVLGYDAKAKRWSVEGCGNKVYWRKWSTTTPGTPGLCMFSPKGSTSKTLQMGNTCNLKADFDQGIPRPLGVMNSALKIRLKFRGQQLESHPAYDNVCKTKIDKAMREMCDGISDEAMSQCGVLMSNDAVRGCMYRHGVSGPAQAALFGDCLYAFCSGDAPACQKFKSHAALKKCVPTIRHCEKWTYYFP